MPVGSASILEVVDECVRVALQEVHTCIPAKVKSVDFAQSTVDVELATEASYPTGTGDIEYDKRPLLSGVPVQWPRAGGFVVRLPIKAGDFVMLHFPEQALAEWHATGQVSQPGDQRRHSIGYPYAVPGAFPNSSPPSAADVLALESGDAIVGEDGGRQIRFSALGIELAPAGVTPVSPVALAVPLMAYVTAATAADAARAGSGAAVSTALTKLKAALAGICAATVGALPAPTPDQVTAINHALDDANGKIDAAIAADVTRQTSSAESTASAAIASAGVPSTLVRAV